MQCSSSTRRGRAPLPCAAALAFALAAPFAFADGDTVERKDRTEDTVLSTENKCNGEAVTGRGQLRREQRDTRKADGNTETRIREREHGQGTGSVTMVDYTWNNDSTTVFRSGPNRPTRITNRRDERVLAHSDQVPSWFLTIRTEFRENEEPATTKERCRCNKDDGPSQSVSCESGQPPEAQTTTPSQTPSTPLLGGLLQ